VRSPRKITGNSKGRGVPKAKFFNGKYKAKLECPERMRCSNQKLCSGEGILLPKT